MSDPRFARLKNDPRFRKIKKKQHKVVLDERFKSIFESEGKKGKTGLQDGKGKGKATARVDKYGRRLSSTHEQDNLKRFYRLEGESSGDETHNKVIDGTEAGPASDAKRPDYARGEALLESSSSEEDEDDVESEEDSGGVITLAPSGTAPRPKSTSAHSNQPIRRDDVDLDETQFAELDARALEGHEDDDEDQRRRTTRSGEETSRLAVVNLDWDHVKAQHLFKIFSSAARMAPTPLKIEKGKKKPNSSTLLGGGGGKILSVRVYPSEFGKGRLAKEEREGPPKEVFAKKRSLGGLLVSGGGAGTKDMSDSEEDADDVNESSIFKQGDAEEYDIEALRNYQLERLRYYYAIVTCDSPQTARHIYTELDGTELERTANVFDLSYVPESMNFTNDEVRDECTQELGNFKAVEFVTEALRHSKVKLTWDDDDADRTAITRRTLTKKDIEEGDFRALLASSSSSEGEQEEDPKGKDKKAQSRERLRALLLGGDDGGADDLPEGWGGTEEDKTGEMEISFTPGLSASRGVDRRDEENLTTLDKYLKKQKEKRTQRKAEKLQKLELEMQDGSKDAKATKQRDQVPSNEQFFDEDDEPPQDDHSSQGSDGGSTKYTKPPIQGSRSTLADTTASGSLSIASDEPKHFDMRAVIKSEKELLKKRRKHQKKKRDEDNQEKEDGKGFEVNISDDRFKALHEEHEFAIDPSNPHYKPTLAMKALLNERSRRLKDKEKVEMSVRQGVSSNASAGPGQGNDHQLKKLVESVKRKSAAGTSSTGPDVGRGGSGKKRRIT